jgi:hypothetical protein
MVLHNFRTFMQISTNFIAYNYGIIAVRLGYRHKVCTRWVPKMLTGAHKMQRVALALTFFRVIPQR